MINIFFDNKKIGYLDKGKIYSSDKRLNIILSHIDKEGILTTKATNHEHRLVYTKDKKAFWEFLIRSGFVLVKDK